MFPREIRRPSRREAEQRFTNIHFWNEPAKGGHFAAFEQPGSSSTRCAPRSGRCGDRAHGLAVLDTADGVAGSFCAKGAR